ncbi:uncharacterized protein K489DRAFT_384515 [Dissoconium aciculare CBS 342.82]|uniref:Uncharacterized protein n=1 Tax=Dissoconium aciculare CBS 342.82 TaxID=1314786 RepID=A0A6J3LTR2_9PEZI|nr:uncharacterized protein K489DRAFT_384515 [Dissoconium aciculare CBS 342.82]KAF1819018.1 hypothetical protein K489DRAFT_384515 [Dissoconium aciculare CBS 342.82]
MPTTHLGCSGILRVCSATDLGVGALGIATAHSPLQKHRFLVAIGMPSKRLSTALPMRDKADCVKPKRRSLARELVGLVWIAPHVHHSRHQSLCTAVVEAIDPAGVL